MLRLSTFCMLLALGAAQNGYDYNRPNRPFGPGSSSSRPGSSSTTTPYPIRPQSDDYNGPTTGYPSGPPSYPSSSQRPGYPGPSYPGQGPPSGPSGPGGYPSGPGGYPGGPGGPPSGPGGYPGSPSGPGSYPGGPGGYPGQPDNNYPQGPSSGYPGPSDSSYPQGTRGPSGGGFPGSRYPGQGQNYPGQPGNAGFSDDSGNYENGDYSAIPGEPDIDYPVLSYIPRTNFNCKAQQYPGYYADVETRCQVFHICANNRTYDFLCPNGTVFSQEDFVCVWWNQFGCETAPGLYELNAKIYDYSNRDSSNFPVSSFNDYPDSNYPGRRGPQGPSYPGSGTSRPGGNYPGGPGSQGPTTPFPSVPLTSSYPGSRGSSSYPGQSTPGNYPGSQGPNGNYPSYQGPGSYPSGPQGPGGPGSPGSGYPTSSTPYPGTTPGSQGYPSGRPNGPSFPSPNNGRQPQKPNREYLPPRNKRTKGSKH